MKIVLQRVLKASVEIKTQPDATSLHENLKGQSNEFETKDQRATQLDPIRPHRFIQKGWLVLLGVGADDTTEDVIYLSQKILNLRAFPDQDGKMNQSILDIHGDILLVSQFTLLADCSKGRRPSFINAAPPSQARILYQNMLDELKKTGLKIESGVFQADMLVSLCNDGPVTFVVESPKRSQIKSQN